MKTHYNTSFYEGQKSGSKKSAEIIVPYILELLSPSSVLDVGCGVGTWLRVCLDNGIEDILGIDGEYVNREQLIIPSSKFTPHDLVKPLPLNRKYDLAICLEVAEHLSEIHAKNFIKELVNYSNAIIFSAAIPFQGGTHHVNEQWQSYWADLFREHGLVPVDIIRPFVWRNSNVEYWYKQNILLYMSQENAESLLGKGLANKELAGLDIVHPKMFLERVDPRRVPYADTPRLLYGIMSAILRKLWKK